MLICTLIFIAMQFLQHGLQRQILYFYGMVPIRYADPQWAYSFGLPPDGYLSFVTSLFLHSDWYHIISNMIFMWIFADNVEDAMGRWRFLIFYLLCGILATYLQWWNDPRLAIPVVGASGAIAGVLGAYFFLFPQAKVIVLIPILFYPLLFDVPAIAFLGFWVIMQMEKASTSTFFAEATTNIALWAHLGGFIAGAVLHPLFIKRKKALPE